MKKKASKLPTVKDEDSMRTEYDFTGAERGRYAKKFAESTNVVRLDPDVAEVFPNALAVNEALRTLIRLLGKGKAKKKG